MTPKQNQLQRDAHVRAALGLPHVTFDPSASYPAPFRRGADRIGQRLTQYGRARTTEPGWHRLTR